MINLTRRRFLSLSASAAFGSLLPSLPGNARADGLDNLTLWGPPVGPSIALAHVAEKGNSRKMASNLSFRVWRTPDQLRAGVVSGDIQISGVPSYVGANLYNKGVPVNLMNIMTWGLLYMLSSDSRVQKLEDIAGRTVTMPFKNDMPDLVFQYITAKAGMKPGKDFKLQYASTPFEVVQMMMAGKADICINPEPAATAMIMKGKSSSIGVNRVLSIQEEWGKATGGAPKIPQAGLMVSRELADKNMDFLKTLQADCIRSSEWALNNPVSAGQIAEDYLGVKGPIAELSMPYINLDTISAFDAKTVIEDFFTKMAELNPKIIGGKLPSADFYLNV